MIYKLLKDYMLIFNTNQKIKIKMTSRMHMRIV